MTKSLKYALVAMLSAAAACTTATSNLTNAPSPKDLPGYVQPYDVVFSAALDAVSVLSWEVTVAQKDAGIISAKAPMSLWTYGDKISIRIFRPDSLRRDSLVRVGFTSGTDQAYDWGKNSRNKTAFYKRLDLLLKPTR
jgi:hypothetical protein